MGIVYYIVYSYLKSMINSVLHFHHFFSRAMCPINNKIDFSWTTDILINKKYSKNTRSKCYKLDHALYWSVFYVLQIFYMKNKGRDLKLYMWHNQAKIRKKG